MRQYPWSRQRAPLLRLTLLELVEQVEERPRLCTILKARCLANEIVDIGDEARLLLL